MTNFVHLHCHSEYSLVDGLLRLKTFTSAVADSGMPAVALTDQSNLFAMVKFYRAAMAAGIKPIIGCDVWVQSKKNNKKPYRLLLLCQNQQGYKNLTTLISRAYVEDQVNDKPIVYRDHLETANAGLIAIAPSTKSDVADALLTDQNDLAESLLKEWMQIFENRFYISIARTERPDEQKYIELIVPLAAKKQCPLVATNEVCLLKSSDFDAHEARVCVNEGRVLSDPSRSHRYSAEQYLKAPVQMERLFSDIPEALQNTMEIAKRCNLILELDNVYLPQFPVPKDVTTEQYLSKVSKKGLESRFKVLSLSDPEKDKYYDRLELELKVINSMGFAGYFLIVFDFIQWAKEHDIPVGPGRGSGAGSLAAYALCITDVDPLQYDLLFERFLNPDRVSMPDFDIDFCMEGRDRVIEYVANTYGKDAVSQIITYGTMAAKAVIRDVGRVLGHPYGFVDRIAKLIPMEVGITLETALKQEDALRDLYKKEEEVKTLINLAKKLEGITRNVGKHAGGVVIAPSKLTDYTPLYSEANEGALISQFDKNDIETIGLVKFDFLGLRTLTIIKWTVDTVNRYRKQESEELLHIEDITLNDQKTFVLLQKCITTAVFQLESRGMKDLIKRLRPDCFEEIIALVALFRPGPLQSGMVDDFIDRKLGVATIEYPHPDLEAILQPTYGVILYQEQVMQIAQVLAGYTLGAADLLRRAMGKKKPEEMAKQRAIFISGAVDRGVDGKIATYIFDLMEKLAGYGFNKSHSAAYALISYQTAWLKTHYPAAFMAAVLSSDMTNTDKVVMFLEDCKLLELEVLHPDVNQSVYKFSVANGDVNSKIIYGLGAIKGIGEAAISEIAANRTQQGPFKDIFDLCSRVDSRKVTKRVFEALIKSGALDCFGMHRAALMGSLPSAMQAADQFNKNTQHGQIDLFGSSLVAADLGNVVEEQAFLQWSESVRLANEKATLGLYISGHNITQNETELGSITNCKIANLRPDNNQKQTIAGLVIAMRTLLTKRGDRMAFITIDDNTGRQEIAVFSDQFYASRDILKKDELLIISGQASVDDYSGGIRFRCDTITSLEAVRLKRAKYIKINISSESITDSFASSLKEFLNPDTNNGCAVRIVYKKQQAEAIVNLGDKWRASPSRMVLDQINSLEEVTKTEVCY